MTNTARNNIIPMTNPTTTTRSSGSSSVNTAPGVSPDKARLLNAYQRVLGKMTSQIGWYLTELIEDGMEIDVIIHAIEETAWARNPSPRYMRCILERYRDDEIYSMSQLRADVNDFNLTKAEMRSDAEWWR